MGDKLNCWQVMDCGREPGGHSVLEKGICPVTQDEHYAGANNGKASGRFCWTELQTSYSETTSKDFPNCLRCMFFSLVQRQEGKDFVMSRSAFIGNITSLPTAQSDNH